MISSVLVQPENTMLRIDQLVRSGKKVLLKDLLKSEECLDKLPTTALNFVGYSLIDSSTLFKALCGKDLSQLKASSEMRLSEKVEVNLALFRGVASGTTFKASEFGFNDRPHERHMFDSLTKSAYSGSSQIWHPVSSPDWSSEVIEDSGVSHLEGNSVDFDECIP